LPIKPDSGFRGNDGYRATPTQPPGFTLVELAITLFIVTLLLGGMLTPLSQQIAERQNSETRHTLDNARTALVGYALSHRDTFGLSYLPCPDLHSGAGAGDGEEDRLPDGHCATVVGGLPWHTLGVAETDAWGNHLDYAVSPEFADAGHGIGLANRSQARAKNVLPPSGRAPNAFAEPVTQHPPAPATQVDVCPDKTCAKPLVVAAVILSHGRNGFGAYNGVGGRNLAPTSEDERANADSNPRFVMRSPSAADRASGEFDDLVTWLSPAWLLGRLCDPAANCAEP
jgi:type II secretory pathway pseudopilin PulG